MSDPETMHDVAEMLYHVAKLSFPADHPILAVTWDLWRVAKGGTLTPRHYNSNHWRRLRQLVRPPLRGPGRFTPTGLPRLPVECEARVPPDDPKSELSEADRREIESLKESGHWVGD